MNNPNPNPKYIPKHQVWIKDTWVVIILYIFMHSKLFLKTLHQLFFEREDYWCCTAACTCIVDIKVSLDCPFPSLLSLQVSPESWPLPSIAGECNRQGRSNGWAVKTETNSTTMSRLMARATVDKSWWTGTLQWPVTFSEHKILVISR